MSDPTTYETDSRISTRSQDCEDRMTEFTVGTPAFRQALATAIAFASDDATLVAINLVHIAPVESGIEIAASDRFALSVEQISASGEPFAFSIPYNIAQQLRMMLSPPRNAIPSLCRCGHTEDAHNAPVQVPGSYECYQDVGDSVCPCSWYEPREEMAGTVCVTKYGTKVTVRLGGEVKTAVTFTPPEESGVRFIDYRALIENTKKPQGDPVETTAFMPALLGRVCGALAARDRHTAMTLRYASAGKAVIVEQGAALTVLVMPARLVQQKPRTSPAATAT